MKNATILTAYNFNNHYTISKDRYDNGDEYVSGWF